MEQAILLYQQGYSSREILEQLKLSFGERQLQRRLKALGIVKGVKTTKKCCICKEIKIKAEFYKNRARDDGLDTFCKICALKHGAPFVSRWIRENKDKHRAQDLAGKHRHEIKKSYCEECKITDIKLEMHHPDYSKPLFVITLCKEHHELVHHGIKKEIQI